ncbi:dickkopf-related protein [Sandaracinus amylolyticus]|uniref:dickkopf-related protein n=1 Tax=Sandaracinus amylolyticus TaxID=927083 RepID=UPI001F16A626|nr:dickkopf-related protein [Sandaracinus amylolyticus]UJR86243.1 Hypothetical protein I5071_83250 [Sandaracinus amylolyticus]
MNRSIPIVMWIAMLAGCAAEAPQVEQRELALTREELAEVSWRVDGLVRDPAFEAWLGIAVRIAAIRAVELSRATDAAQEAHAELVSDFPRIQEQYSPGAFYTALALDPALIDRQGALYAALDQRYALSPLSRDLRREVLDRAVTRFSRERRAIDGWIEYELDQIDPEGTEDVSDACILDCQRRFATAAALALQAYIASLAAATIAGPAWPVLVIAATAAYSYALYEANEANEDCIAECEGIPPTDYCEEDSDCADDEYCWTGVLGVGMNECRPKKDEGRTCSRHGQCESGCCRLHVPTNPVSRVCRPSDRC